MANKSNQERASFVEEVILNKIVKGYIVGDLRRMLDVEVIEDHDGNINFPIALYTFASMEFLGYLVSDEFVEEEKGGYTKKYILAYVELLFSNEDKQKVKPHEEYFVKIFRHGLVHEFFPKMAGISRVNSDLITISADGTYWVLDADILANMFIRSVSKLEELIKSTEFCLRMYERYSNKSLKDQPMTDRPSTGDIGSGAYDRSQGDTGVAGVEEQIDS